MTNTHVNHSIGVISNSFESRTTTMIMSRSVQSAYMLTCMSTYIYGLAVKAVVLDMKYTQLDITWYDWHKHVDC